MWKKEGQKKFGSHKCEKKGKKRKFSPKKGKKRNIFKKKEKTGKKRKKGMAGHPVYW